MKTSMITSSFLISSLFGAVLAHPMHHHRRALEIVTFYTSTVVVEYVTSTVYYDEPTSAPALPVVETTPTPVAVPTTTSKPPQVFVAPPSSTPKPVVVTPTPKPKPATTAAPPPPPPTTVAAPPPPPTTVVAPPPPPPAPTTVAAPPPAATSSAPAPPSGNFRYGDGTFYATGLGSCGLVNHDTDMIAALGHGTMDLTNPGNPNKNPVCGKQVRAFSDSNPEGILVSIVDTCAGCAGADDLDFSPAAFDKLGAEATGRIKIWWEWA